MNETAAPNLSVRQLLFREATEEESIETLQQRLDPAVVGNLLTGASAALQGTAKTEVGRAINGVLGMDAIDAVVMGWRKHGLLLEAARRTLASPESREVVELARHRVTAGYQPNVNVFVDDLSVGQIDLSLKLTADVIGLLGIVGRGRLLALRSGHVDLAAVLRCQGADLAVGERRINLATEVSLGEGIRLVDETETRGEPA